MKRKKQKKNRTILISPVFLLKYITVYVNIMIRKRGQRWSYMVFCKRSLEKMNYQE